MSRDAEHSEPAGRLITVASGHSWRPVMSTSEQGCRALGAGVIGRGAAGRADRPADRRTEGFGVCIGGRWPESGGGRFMEVNYSENTLVVERSGRYREVAAAGR